MLSAAKTGERPGDLGNLFLLWSGSCEANPVVTTETDAADRRRAVEALAQALYEASDPAGVPWVRRARVIREAWLLLAEEQLTRGGRSPVGDGTA